MALSISNIFSKRFHLKYIRFSTTLYERHIHSDKENSTSLQSGASSTQDVLLQNIRNAHNPKELMTVISSHCQVFNHKHVIDSFSCLHDFKKNLQDESLENVINDPTFERLCLQLKKFSRTLALSDILEALKSLCFLNVPSNSQIFQMLLQLIRDNINDLDLQQIVFLDFVLHKSGTSHLTDALKLALPLVFQLNVSMQMDKENMEELSNLLRYTTLNKVPTKCVTSIVTAMVLNESQMKKDTALSIVWSLCKVYTPNDELISSYYEKLLSKCFSVLIANINSIQFPTILKTLQNLKEKVAKNQLSFYNSEFINACGDYVIFHSVPFQDAIRVAKVMTRIGHDHLQLLEYLSEFLVVDPEIMKQARPSVVFSYMNALCFANYKPLEWEIICKQIIQNPIIKTKIVEYPWTKFAIELASFDIYVDEMLNFIFSESFLKEYLSREYNLLDRFQLLHLYQAIKAFYPEYQGNFPTKILDDTAVLSCNKSVDRTMQSALKRALGGSQYFASQVQLPHGIFADFVIAYGNDNIPININPENNETAVKFEDLKISPKHDVVCILNYHKGSYSLNNHRLRGQIFFMQRIIKQFGYKVVPISLHQWEEMPDMEKIPYIMREIKYTLDTSKQNNKIENEMI